jgi:CheY-like chemotaxis protein
VSPRVLFVEDDGTDVVFLKRAFLKTGFEAPVDVVDTGLEAIAYLAGSGPYADRARHPSPTHVLLDLKLPEKSGLEVLQWIRQQAGLGGLHVAILTSSSEASDIRRAVELRAEAYWVKPMSFSLLLDVARSIGRWVKTGEVPAAVVHATTRRGP